MTLSSESIAAIRKLLSQQLRREIKQLLIEAGARADRILSIPVVSDMKSWDYHTTEDILSKGFDTIYVDFEKDEADGILLRIIKLLFAKGVDISNVHDKLISDGINLEHLLSLKPSETTKVRPITTNIQEIKEGPYPKDLYEYDVFICHASEDKDSFVRPLSKELSSRGLRVWYDEFSLKLGDSLRRSIELGLTKSRFGIVVLSLAFFNKEWPQKELDGLIALEFSGRKVILPIWHKIDQYSILKYSPILADRVAVNSSLCIEHVVSELLKVVKPRDEYEKLLSNTMGKWVTHGILPSIEELYVLWENINPNNLTRDEMAFLYCAYLSRDEELLNWADDGNPIFSFAYLTDYIAKCANFNKSILSAFHFTKRGAGAFGGLSSQVGELKNVALSEVRLLDDDREAPALYCFVQDPDNRGL
jgi:hypothetical protein